jgi:hypothetical protein
MSVYVWVSLGVLALVVHDLIRGQITSLMSIFFRPPLTLRDNPRRYWSSIAWRVVVAGAVIAMAWFHVANPRWHG